VLPLLATYPSIKVWCAGCSAGEEAYSLAILLHEEGLLDRSIIYATDINAQSLRMAASGVFSLSRLRGFTENHRRAGGSTSLSDYYHSSGRAANGADGAAIMDPALRRKITFSDHSLATDHVFSEVHLITCRNVLIYFDRALQTRALRLFAESLVQRGFLGLGSKESLRFTEAADLYTDFSLPERLYRKKAP
jgi:chemotaxis protein methyltransferase CheR